MNNKIASSHYYKLVGYSGFYIKNTLVNYNSW